MRKLLRANAFRLRRSKALWLCMAGAFVLTAAFLLKIGAENEQVYTLDEAVFQVFPFLPVFHAAFAGLFLGAEYQDGTLRNKLIAGHPRQAVYAASLVTATVGCFAILLAWALGAVIGILRFGWFTAPAGQLLLNAAVVLLLTAANAAILTLLSMLCSNRAITAVVAILLMFGLMLLGSGFYNALCEPAFQSAAIVTDHGVEVGELQPNPNYVAGTLRMAYQFLVDALPSGQAILLANQELTHPAMSLCASAGIALLTSAAGIAAFKRKDLK